MSPTRQPGSLSRLVAAFALVAAAAMPAGADPSIEPHFGGMGTAPVDGRVPCLDDAQRARIVADLAASRARLGLQVPSFRTLAPATVAFGWPLRLRPVLDDPGHHGISNFLDHDFERPGLLRDFQCAARTYDTSGYNHSGTDLFTWPFGWKKMDFDEVEIVAAAPGVIVHREDGNYDRNCGFGSGDWNAVYVQHDDGSIAWYGHMKFGSTIAKDPGETVVQGEVLGVVGSSGNSTGPHLHFEVYDAGGDLIDPFAGPCNLLNAESWWAAQPQYFDSAINALRTHDAAPQFPPCPATEITHERDAFAPGERIYFGAYYRDQRAGQVTNFRLYDGSGGLYTQWNSSSSEPHYAASYWYWWFDLPAVVPSPGFWRFEASFQGKTVAHPFWLGSLTAVEDGPRPALALAARGALPSSGPIELDATLPDGAAVRLSIVDARGRRVARLADGWYPAGTHRFRWEAAAPAGVYLARLEAGAGATATRKLIVLD